MIGGKGNPPRVHRTRTMTFRSLLREVRSYRRGIAILESAGLTGTEGHRLLVHKLALALGT